MNSPIPRRSTILSLFFLMGISLLYSQNRIVSDTQKKETPGKVKNKIIPVIAADFSAGWNMIAMKDSSTTYEFQISDISPVPFTQSAVKQSNEVAGFGPDPDSPYFTVRFAMPVPPSYTTTDVAALTGMDSMVYVHNHSPGFEILPNGDALAVYFSTPVGKKEADTSTSFVQVRLRYGSEDWDMPELFFKTQGQNDQSALLWNDNGKLWFFGGGRNISHYVPFRIATSTDNGATWTYSIPIIDKKASSYTAQPITNAFRGPDRSIYLTMDGDGSQSFLWKSTDDGHHWHDMGGRTGGRHSVIVPLDDQGNLLSIGGKNSDVDGWSPYNISSDWGATWSKNTASPFPALGARQRPSMIRLASGNLLFVSDSYLHSRKKDAPEGWEYGDNCFVAISKDNGISWHIKELPVQMPVERSSGHPTLGYVTVKQAPNGVIHLLTTITRPCLHYEFNESWIWSDARDITPESSGGTIREFVERYPNGQLRSRWTARICANGRYLLHGEEIDYYEDGSIQHTVCYKNGRKTGEEIYWLPDGTKAWSWHRNLKTNVGVWTHYWKNGKKKIESTWILRPEVPVLKRTFFGYLAEGPCRHWDKQGKLVATYHFKDGDLIDADVPADK